MSSHHYSRDLSKKFTVFEIHKHQYFPLHILIEHQQLVVDTFWIHSWFRKFLSRQICVVILFLWYFLWRVIFLPCINSWIEVSKNLWWFVGSNKRQRESFEFSLTGECFLTINVMQSKFLVLNSNFKKYKANDITWKKGRLSERSSVIREKPDYLDFYFQLIYKWCTC